MNKSNRLMLIDYHNSRRLLHAGKVGTLLVILGTLQYFVAILDWRNHLIHNLTGTRLFPFGMATGGYAFIAIFFGITLILLGTRSPSREYSKLVTGIGLLLIGYVNIGSTTSCGTVSRILSRPPQLFMSSKFWVPFGVETISIGIGGSGTMNCWMEFNAVLLGIAYGVLLVGLWLSKYGDEKLLKLAVVVNERLIDHRDS